MSGTRSPTHPENQVPVSGMHSAVCCMYARLVLPLVENKCGELPAPLASLLFAYEGWHSQHTIFLCEGWRPTRKNAFVMSYKVDMNIHSVSVIKLIASK